MLRRNMFVLPRRGIMTAGVVSWRMSVTNMNNMQIYPNHVEGIRHNNNNNNNDNDNTINCSMAPTVPFDLPVPIITINSDRSITASTSEEKSQHNGEDRIIESVLNTPLLDLINQHAASAWNELQNSNIDTLGSWLQVRLSSSTNFVIRNCFERQLCEIEAIGVELARLRSSNDKKERKKRHERISAIEGRLKELHLTSFRSLSPKEIGDLMRVAQVETVGDWLSLACSADATSFPFDADSSEIGNVFGLIRLFLRNRHGKISLISILRERYRQLLLEIHRENPSASCEIFPGSSHRHTAFPLTGLLGRQSLLSNFEDRLSKFNEINSKESFALFTISSLPRQGKTALLDWIGYDRKLVSAFAGELANPNMTFILNMTFNALWPAQNAAQHGSSYEFATTQMKLRLLAAGLTKFNEKEFSTMQPKEKMLIYMLVAAETFTTCLNDVVTPGLRSLRNIPVKTSIKTILLFDEFSNIEPRRDSMPPFEFEKLREAIYSAATQVINCDTLVVMSGFTTAPSLVTKSGRVICDFQLDPIVTSIQARETMPMRSKFFGMSGRLLRVEKRDPIFDAPMAVYELAKSSPGVLGAILELCSGDSHFSLSAIVNQIPFLKRLKDDRSLHDQMIKILKYKSFQFLPAAEFSKSPLFRTVSLELVDAVFSSAIFTPASTYSEKPDAEADAGAGLVNAHIEPLFLARSFRQFATTREDFNEFGRFLEQLECYSDAVFGPAGAAGKAVVTEFGRLPSSTYLDVTTTHRSSIKSMTSSLFETLVLTGILFQRQLRHSLLASANYNNPSIFPTRFWKFSRQIRRLFRSPTDDDFTGYECPLSNFLEGSSEIISLANDGKSQPMLVWDDSSTRSTIHRFNSSRIPYPHLKPNSLKSEAKACQEDLSFSLNSIHLPKRPAEKNPVADIIFHEKSSDGRLVQFWIDTKHSDGDPLPNLDVVHARAQLLASPAEKYPTLILDCLNNPLLQNPNCAVDHVVHIVVTSWSRDREQQKKNDVQSSAAILQKEEPPSEQQNDEDYYPIPQHEKILGRLASYSLFYVRPGDIAFENLVSEPVKLGMPLLEEVDADTWAQKLPANIKEWPRYKAVKRVASMVMQLTDADFEHLKNLAFVEDCAMTMLHSAVDSGFTSKALVSSDQDRLFKFLPFGSWLDALGALPSGWNSKPFFKKATLRQDPDNDEAFEFVIGAELEQHAGIIVKLRSDYVKHVTQNAVTIGHLFHNRPDMARRDAITEAIWREFFEEGGRTQTETKNLRLACGILWTTTIKEWNEDIKFSTKLSKSSTLLQHEFATKSAREIIKELEDSNPRILKSIRNSDSKERINISDVIQNKVEKILKLINVTSMK